MQADHRHADSLWTVLHAPGASMSFPLPFEDALVRALDLNNNGVTVRALAKVGSDERLGAEQILSAWRERGFV